MDAETITPEEPPKAEDNSSDASPLPDAQPPQQDDPQARAHACLQHVRSVLEQYDCRIGSSMQAERTEGGGSLIVSSVWSVIPLLVLVAVGVFLGGCTAGSVDYPWRDGTARFEAPGEWRGRFIMDTNDEGEPPEEVCICDPCGCCKRLTIAELKELLGLELTPLPAPPSAANRWYRVEQLIEAMRQLEEEEQPAEEPPPEETPEDTGE